MRLMLLVFSFLLVVCSVEGQSRFTFEPQANTDDDVAYIHILYRVDAGFGFRLRTTFDPDNPVKLTPNSYTLLKVAENYIGFFSNAAAQTKPLVLDLERGKHYFYRFTRFDFELNVDEMTEQEFRMELFFNHTEPTPKRTYEFGLPGAR